MILVTGANGTVGRALASQLAGRVPIRLALHDPARGKGLAEAQERVRFDFLDSSTFEAALRGVDRVFLLRPPRLARARHDFGAFVAAMGRVGVRQVAFLSVRGAQASPLLPHRRIERLLEQSGLAWTHLRPNDFMQNLASVHREDIRERSEIWAPAGRGSTSFVDARDVAAAAARVLTQPGHDRRAYTLTGGESLDLFQVASTLSQVLGRSVTYRNPGLLSFHRHLRAQGTPVVLGLVMTGVYTAARLGVSAGISPDFEQLTGRPPTSLHTFVEDYAATWA